MIFKLLRAGLHLIALDSLGALLKLSSQTEMLQMLRIDKFYDI